MCGLGALSGYRKRGQTVIQPDLGRNEGVPAFLVHALNWVEFRRVALRRQQHYLVDLIAADGYQIVSDDSLAQAVEQVNTIGEPYRI